MAGTWRISLERLEGLTKSSLVDVAKSAFNSLNRRSSDYGNEDIFSSQIIFEVVPSQLADGPAPAAQRTKPCEVNDEGNARINRVFFMPAPVQGGSILVRVIKSHRLLQDSLIGEARITEAVGTKSVEVSRKGKRRATLHLSVTTGLPGPPMGDMNSTYSEQSAGPCVSSASAAASVPSNKLMPPNMSYGGPPQPVSPNALGQMLPPSPTSAELAAAPGFQPSPMAMPALMADSPTSGRYAQGGVPALPAAALATGAVTRLVSDNKVADVVCSPAVGAQTPGSQTMSVKSMRSSGRRAMGARTSAGGEPSGPRRLRKRPPNLPVIGTCDVVISGVTDMHDVANPYLIIGMEGQEFLIQSLATVGASSRGECRFTFSIGSVQSSLQVYLYDDAPGPHRPKGRVLVPLNDVVWPTKEGVSFQRLRSGFQPAEKPYVRDYVMCFLPPSEHGDGGPSEAAFWDSYSFSSLDDCASGAQGVLHVGLEVTLCSEAQPLLAFYAKSVVAGVHRVMALGSEGGPSRARNRARSLLPAPGLADWSEPGAFAGAKDLMQSPEFQSVMQSIERWHRNANAEPIGLTRWVRQKPTHAYVAAGGWFLFCIAGFFPCPLWLAPLYAWCIFAGNALLVASQRNEDLAHEEAEGDEEGGRRIVAAGPFPPLGVVGDLSGARSAAMHIARWQKVVRLVEPALLTAVGYKARLRNLLGFTDGAASIANFVVFAMMAGVLSLYLLLISAIDPSLNFMSGLYGAVAIVSYARMGQLADRCEPLWWQWAFNEVFACAPDDLQAVHRFVSTHVQCLEP